jgi:DNA-directed RNA polymerase specialized sigma24 family protein
MFWTLYQRTPMTDEEALKFHKRAILTARKMGFAEYAEDLAQDVLVAFLSGNDHQTIDHAVICALRKMTRNTARTSSSKSAQRRLFWANSKALDNESKHPKCYQSHNFGDFDKIIMLARPSSRSYLIKRFEADMTLLEVRESTGKTEAAVSIGVKTGLNDIRRRKGCFL